MAKKHKDIERKPEDPKRLAAVQDWGKKQFTACAHGTLDAAVRADNSSKPGPTWHPFWTGRVHVKCSTCGTDQFFNWFENEHGKETFGKK